MEYYFNSGFYGEFIIGHWEYYLFKLKPFILKIGKGKTNSKYMEE